MLLKAHDLITSPAFIVIKAADEFKDKTTAPNQLWQTGFTYLKVIGWGWYYLSTILDDYSRYIIAWKLCTTMRTDDVTDTLKLALAASGCGSAKVVRKPRLLSDHGSSYISSDLTDWLQDHGMAHVRGAPCHPQTQARSSVGTKRSRTAFCSRTITCRAISNLKSHASSSTTITGATTKAYRPDAGGHLLRQRPDHPPRTKKDQSRHHQTATIATPIESRLNSNPKRARTSVTTQLRLSQSI